MMTDTPPPSDSATAAYVAFEQFRQGLPLGRFHVIVNPHLAATFVTRRLNVVPVSIAVVGTGVATALAGYSIVGAVLVLAGVVFRRVVKWQAPKILLYLASHQPTAYHDATSNGVMEVRHR